MHSLIKLTLISLLYFSFYSTTLAENLFYILRSNTASQISATQQSFSSLEKHYKSIDILVSQAYQIDENGVVWGYLDKDVFEFAKQNSMKIMPLITNVSFDKLKAHTFLSSPEAQKRAIQAILAACKQNHFYGVQLDFEMIQLEDKEALTRFYQDTAAQLHKNGFVVSIAVAPLIMNEPITSEFQKRLFTNWEGAYNFKALGESADFLSIMAYNQHASGIMTPGPTAGIRWVEATIRYALQYVPPEKISLGVSSYSGYWFTGTDPDDPAKKMGVQYVGIDYDKAAYLLKKYHANLQWNDTDKVHYAIYEHDWVYEYLFIEDAQSFKAKLDLVKKYHLRGISVFYMGIEDPQIWKVLGSGR